MPSLEQVDAELLRWRDRLAAASRNVSELSELPDFGAARSAASGTGRLAEEARGLVATMDELWQGVLLIGAALDRAEQARQSGSRLWRGEEAARQAMDILEGASITVDLSETPVLHRRLLAGPRATVTVTPGTLLQTMDTAFDRARESLARVTQCVAQAAAVHARLEAALASLPVPAELAQQLAAALLPDPLDRLDALNRLAPAIEAAAATAARARHGIEAARAQVAVLQQLAADARAKAAACRTAVAAVLPPDDAAGLADLQAWLERIGHTLDSGRVEACLVGLAKWQNLHDRLMGQYQALSDAAAQAVSRRDDLLARLGALRAKQRARQLADPAVEALAAAAKQSLQSQPSDLDAASRDVAAYGAALAQR